MLHLIRKNLKIHLLQNLSRVKGWDYHDHVELEKKEEIKIFMIDYIFKLKYGDEIGRKLSYNKLDFVINKTAFMPFIKAVLSLLEVSKNEMEFNLRYTNLFKHDTGLPDSNH